MKVKSLDFFQCPHCEEGRFTLSSHVVQADGEALEGNLSCSACQGSVPVRAGVPRFVVGSNYADSFGLQWNLYRRTQLDSYTGVPISRRRLFSVTGWAEKLDGELILEAGSGSGRFTEVLLSAGAEVFSFDYSLAVDSNWLNHGSHPRLHLFQGDLFKLPLHREVFDKAVCLGVLQHTPDPAMAFNSLVRHLRPGGELVIDIYAKSWKALLQWKYLLRPITTRMEKRRLYRGIARAVPVLLPLSAFLRRVAGRYGARLLPIAEYSHLGLPASLNREWAILDTFDMYSPVHDHPQTLATVRGWFEAAGLEKIQVEHGPNGIVARGRRREILK